MHWTVVLTHVALVVAGAAGLSKLRRPRSAGVKLTAAVAAPPVLRRRPFLVGAGLGIVELGIAVWAATGSITGWVALGVLYGLLVVAASRVTLVGAPDCGCHATPSPPSWWQVAGNVSFALAPLLTLIYRSPHQPLSLIAVARDAGPVAGAVAYLGGVVLLAALAITATGLLVEVRAAVARLESVRGAFTLAASTTTAHPGRHR